MYGLGIFWVHVDTLCGNWKELFLEDIAQVCASQANPGWN